MSGALLKVVLKRLYEEFGTSEFSWQDVDDSLNDQEQHSVLHNFQRTAPGGGTIKFNIGRKKLTDLTQLGWLSRVGENSWFINELGILQYELDKTDCVGVCRGCDYYRRECALS